MKNVLFILFGAPASGKGYLGDKIRQEFIDQGFASKEDIVYLSTGDLLRKEVSLQTPLGLEIDRLINSGHYVPDHIVDELVAKAFKADQKVMFLDGYPRTKEQLANLASVIYALKKPTMVVALKRDIPLSEIKIRAQIRRVCANCQTTHTVSDGKCPKCGGASIVRKDDAQIDKRLAVYQKHTEGLWQDLSYLCDLSMEIPHKYDAEDAAFMIVDICNTIDA